MDMARLARALEALEYQEAWRRWHGPEKGKSIDDGRRVAELKGLLRGKHN